MNYENKKVYKRTQYFASCFRTFAKVLKHWEQSKRIADISTKKQQNKGCSGW